MVHSNTVENVFSVFKRGMEGVYQHSEKPTFTVTSASSSSATIVALALAGLMLSASKPLPEGVEAKRPHLSADWFNLRRFASGARHFFALAQRPGLHRRSNPDGLALCHSPSALIGGDGDNSRRHLPTPAAFESRRGAQTLSGPSASALSRTEKDQPWPFLPVALKPGLLGPELRRDTLAHTPNRRDLAVLPLGRVRIRTGEVRPRIPSRRGNRSAVPVSSKWFTDKHREPHEVDTSVEGEPFPPFAAGAGIGRRYVLVRAAKHLSEDCDLC